MKFLPLLPLLLASVVLQAPIAPGAQAEPAAPTEGEWRLTRDADGIRAYHRRSEGSEVLAFKGEATLDAPIGLVVSVLLDAQRAGEWIPMLSESTVLRWISKPHEYLQFTRFDAPWPVADRVFLSHVVVAIDAETWTTTIRYNNAAAENLPPRASEGSAIQGFAGGSSYEVRASEDGAATHLVAISVADPKGAIPAWLINWAGKSWGYDTMRSLRSQLGRSDVRSLPIIDALYPSRLSRTRAPGPAGSAADTSARSPTRAPESVHSCPRCAEARSSG